MADLRDPKNTNILNCIKRARVTLDMDTALDL